MDGSVDTLRRSGDIRKMFAGIAGTYDLLNHLLSLNRDREWRRRAVAASAGRQPILDICAGTGDMAIEWARARGGAGEPVFASDFCQEMLALFSDKVRARRLSGRFRVLAGDALSLPFRSDSFGTVSVAFGIRNVSSLRGGLAEMVRVTRPGGEVVVLEFTTPESRWFRALYFAYFLLVLPLVGNLVSGSRDNAYGYLPRSVRRFPGRTKLKRIMEEAGLTTVKVDNLSLGIVNVLVGTKP